MTATTVPCVFVEEPLEPRNGLGIQVVRRLVEQQQVRRGQEQATERHTSPLTTGELGDIGIGRRAAQRVHGDLELAIEIPCVGALDGLLDGR